MKEKEFQSIVIGMAQAFGWRVAHFRPAKTNKGWRTAVSGDGKGFPDAVLVHAEKARLIFAELKSECGETSPEQDEWLRQLKATGQEVYLWYPSDLDAIEKLLR